jgi:hypothetical protein
MNTGSGFACFERAGTSATASSSLRPSGCARSSGTASVPQYAETVTGSPTAASVQGSRPRAPSVRVAGASAAAGTAASSSKAMEVRRVVIFGSGGTPGR